jgi:hypothetical protein
MNSTDFPAGSGKGSEPRQADQPRARPRAYDTQVRRGAYIHVRVYAGLAPRPYDRSWRQDPAGRIHVHAVQRGLRLRADEAGAVRR